MRRLASKRSSARPVSLYRALPRGSRFRRCRPPWWKIFISGQKRWLPPPTRPAAKSALVSREPNPSLEIRSQSLFDFRVGCHGSDRVAFAQQRPRARYHDVTFRNSLADFHLACGHQAHFDAPCFDPLAAYHLNDGATGTVEDGGQGQRDAAAFAGFDQGTSGQIDQQRPRRCDRHECLTELAVGLSRWRPGANLTNHLTCAEDLDHRGLIDGQLREVACRDLADEVKFVAGNDAEQRLAPARRYPSR